MGPQWNAALQTISEVFCLEQSKLLTVRLEGCLNSMSLCWLLLFFHDTRERVSQSGDFIHINSHGWMEAKPWICGVPLSLHVATCALCLIPR